MGIGFQIPRQPAPHHCSSAAPSPVQTLSPVPHLPPAFIKLTGNAGLPMMLLKGQAEACVPHSGGTSCCKAEFSQCCCAEHLFAPHKSQCLKSAEEKGKAKAKSRQAWQPAKYSQKKTISRKKTGKKKQKKIRTEGRKVYFRCPLWEPCSSLVPATELHTEDSPCPPSLSPQPSAWRTHQPQRFKPPNNSSPTSERTREAPKLLQLSPKTSSR